jgi:hypothetical protein
VGASHAADAALEKRVRAYLARCTPAVSGSGGHTHTLLVAQHVVRGFALDDGDAYNLLAEWNQRCDPPWSEADLKRKLREAREKGTRVEWGAHLRDDRPKPSPMPPAHRDEDAPPPRRLELVREREPGEDDEPFLAQGSTPPVTPTAPPDGPIGATWAPMPTIWLTEQPAPRRWLVRHPTRDGSPCPSGYGDGMFPRGKVGILAAEGGAGKTQAVLGLGVSITTGRSWFGHFHPDPDARQGKVLLALAEEDAEEVHRRIYTLAEEMRLTPQEREAVARRVVILPLAGRPVGFVEYATGRTLVVTPVLADLHRKLRDEAGEHGWSLVVLDPLSRWAGPDAEADNAVATRCIQAIETITAAPGNPGVLVPHHSSKLARRTGQADSRGVTALTDGARWAATLRCEGDDVFFRQVKSNYSVPMPDEIRLIRGTGGVLRAASENEEADRAARGASDADVKSAAKDAKREAKVTTAAAALVQALVASAVPVTSQGAFKGLIGGDSNVKADAVTRLLASGRVVKSDGQFRVVPGVL